MYNIFLLYTLYIYNSMYSNPHKDGKKTNPRYFSRMLLIKSFGYACIQVYINSKVDHPSCQFVSEPIQL